MSRQKSSARFRFSGAAILLSVLILLVPALRSGNSTLYLLCALVPCMLLLCGTMLARMFSLDRMIVAVSLWLCAAGIAALAVSDPDAALAQSLRCGAGVAALLIGGVLIRSLSTSLLTSVCTAFIGLLLLASGLLSPSLVLPLTQVALALLLISFASLLARQGPVSAMLLGIAAMLLLLFRKENTEALFWSITVLFLLFSADGRLIIMLPALAVIGILFFTDFSLLPVSEVRTQSALPALVSAGAVGMDVLPENLASLGADSLFLCLTGHYGLVFSGLTALLFLPLILRGSSVAALARTRFHAILAMGVCLFFALRTIASLLSFFGVLVFPDPALPFLTTSLPDLCSQLFLIGILCGISGRNDADLAEDAHLAMLAK